MSRSAMKQALDFIEQVDYPPYDDKPVKTALRQAIAEAEHPTTHSEECWRWHHECAIARIEMAKQQEHILDCPRCGHCCPGAARQWVGLTPEEAKEISLANRPYVIDMVRALEQRLKEKNT